MPYSTVHRNEVIGFFADNKEEVFSADDIAASLPDIPYSTIYRILGKLCDEGLLEKVSSVSRKAGYRYADPLTCPHHLHLHCQKCGHIDHLSEADSEQIAELVGKTADFQPFMSSTLEGLCRECRRKSKN